MLGDAIDLDRVRRALVIKLRHHGDVLLASPVFTVLKNHAPHIQIDALVYRDTQEMLTLHPAIAEVFTIDRNWKRQGVLAQLRAEAALVQGLKRRAYDLVIHLTEHARGAWLTRFLLRPKASVAREYPGRRGRAWRASFTHLYKTPASPRHTVERHLDALRRLGIYPTESERALTLVPGAEAEAAVATLLNEHGLADKGFIHIHPTSRWLFKCWEPEKYAALIDALQRRGERVVITAAPDQRELDMVRGITGVLERPALDLSGRLSLKQLAALTRRAKCFMGVDSVPMHIAAAVRTPVVALFGPSSDREWAPWQAQASIVSADYACRPCGLDGCGGGKVSECLTAIPVQRVMNALTPYLAA